MFAEHPETEATVQLGRTESLPVAPPSTNTPTLPSSSTHPDLDSKSEDTSFLTALRVEQLESATEGISLLFQVVYDAVANASKEHKPAAEVRMTFQTLQDAATSQSVLHFPLKFEMPSKRSGSSDPELLIT